MFYNLIGKLCIGSMRWVNCILGEMLVINVNGIVNIEVSNILTNLHPTKKKIMKESRNLVSSHEMKTCFSFFSLSQSNDFMHKLR